MAIHGVFLVIPIKPFPYQTNPLGLNTELTRNISGLHGFKHKSVILTVLHDSDFTCCIIAARNVTFLQV